MSSVQNQCTVCGALLNELPTSVDITVSGKIADKSHPKIVATICQCCGREIRIFTQQLKQTKYCPDCQTQRKGKQKFRQTGDNQTSLLNFHNEHTLFASEEVIKMDEKPDALTFELSSNKPEKTFRDSIHGDIDLFDWEVDIVNTPEFQRLRRIKQLGLADLVYPGAVHNRFLHSLGTMFMAQVMIDHINLNNNGHAINEKESQIIRLTALLHDIGHIPFGHTLEKECNIIQVHHDDWSRQKWFIGEGTNIGRILGAKGLYKEVTENLSRLGREPLDTTLPQYLIDIVGNTICADLLDYLKRDGHACGLNLDYDNRIFKYFAIQDSNLVVRLEKHGQYRRDNVSELLTLLRNRYSLNEKVIFHHSKLSASAMLGVAFQLSNMKESDIRMMGQEELLADLTKSKNANVASLAKAINDRELYKVFFIVSREYAEIDDKLSELRKYFYDNPEIRREHESYLENQFGLTPGSIIIYCPRDDMAFKPAEVQV